MEDRGPARFKRGTTEVICIQDLEFSYRSGEFTLRVPDLRVDRGDSLAVIGPSGTGKSTLLNLIAGCFPPDGGSISVAGRDLARLSDADRRRFRIRHIGMVFQEFELIHYLSVLDNILLPYRIAPEMKLDRAAAERASTLASELGLADKLARPVLRLSQGERQRVAICRALVTEPQLVLCDEPTGSLDPGNATRVLDLLFEKAGRLSATMVVVTHNHEDAHRFQRTLNSAELNRSGNP